MNQHLQTILSTIEQIESLSAEEKSSIEQYLKQANKELEITAFKLDRTEKVKRTTAILLEETIAELEQKRKAVEAQNRELEIEGALERVRASAMAMHNSDEIADVARIMRIEIGRLNIEGLFAVTIYLQQDDGTVRLWDITIADSVIEDGPKSSWDMKVRVEELHPRLFITRIWNCTENYFVLRQDEEDFPILIDWVREFKKEDAEEINRTIEQNNIKHTWFAGVQLEHGRLSIELNGPPPDEAESILRKMGATFDLAYTRFLDLQKAEAQAREARIQLALERVRARTMAMQHSNELPDAANLLFEQVQALGVPSWSCGFNIWEEKEQCFNAWMSSEGILQPPFKIPLSEVPTFNRFYESIKKGEVFYVEEMGGDALAAQYEYMRGLPGFGQILDDFLKAGFKLPTFQINHVVNFKQGNLIFITATPVPDSWDIFKRFANVFEQTYTRFLDLQKAEAQAREAQIELGLERVRARAMAMQSSEELKELIGTVSIELTKLDLELNRCVILIYDHVTNGAWWWMVNSEAPLAPMSFFVKYNDLPFFNAYLNGWKERIIKWQYILEGADKIIVDDFLFTETELSQLPDFVIAGMNTPERVYLNASFNNFGCLSMASLEPLSNEHSEILLRFAKVFNLTYTRFNDLKQAEAQAKDARIELGLERVRARAMAMHNSTELRDVVQVMFENLWQMDFVFEDGAVNILVFREGSKDHVQWSADSTQAYVKAFEVAYTDHSIVASLMQARESGMDFFSKIFPVDEKNEYFQHLFEHTNYRDLPDNVKRTILESKQYGYSVAFAQKSAVLIPTNSGRLVPEDKKEILKRFASVFDQAFIRFLDLEKAEAQAREAQIETALERVRSRTMAMYKSGEVMDVAVTVYDELQKLDFKFGAATIIIMDRETGYMQHWLAGFIHNNHIESYPVNNFQHPVHEAQLSAWRKGEKFISIELKGSALKAYAEEMFTQTGYKNLPEEEKVMLAANDHAVFNMAYMSHGALMWAPTALSGEKIIILQRFAKVFEQTYARFLDLQKAEAQAREAEIELALERVRSRSMAMHKSEELRSVVNTLYGELQGLHVNFHVVAIQLIPDDSKDVHIWLSTADGMYDDIIYWPYTDLPVFHEIYKARTTGTMLEFTMTETATMQFFEEYFKLDAVPKERKAAIKNVKLIDIAGTYQKLTGIFLMRYTEGAYSQQEKEIVKRFSKVLEQTYTRFLDLQKAETQARQAKIEASMEKVRSRAMAMQKPNELVEVAELLRKEMGLLGVEELETSSIYIHHEQAAETECWYAIKDVEHPEKSLVSDYMTIDLNETAVGRKILEFYHSGELRISIPMQGDERKEWINYCADRSKVLQGFYGDNIPDRTYHLYKFQNGYMGAASPGNVSAESWELLQRATSVFSLAYTRFNDLQQAEAQAREAKIEASLERVRSRTIGMQKSEELRDVIQIVFEQLRHLDFKIDSAHFNLNYRESDDYNLWTAAPGQPYPVKTYIPYFDHPVFNMARQAKKDGLDFFSESYTQEVKNDFFEQLFTHTPLISEERRKYFLSGHGVAASSVLLNTISLWIMNYAGVPYTAAENAVLKRFGKIFEQSHTRFLDLQKAEAQAREATIEAALEKVRSKAMAMHSSEDVTSTIAVFYRELDALGLRPRGCGVGLMHKHERVAEISTMNATESGEAVAVTGNIKMEGHPLLEGIYDGWLHQKEFHTVLRGNAIKEYYKILKPQISFPQYHGDAVQYGHFFTFKEGGVYAWTEKELGDDELNIYRRFTSVLSLTYRRYIDLKEAETQAREATIETALERVRAKAMSMHSSENLAETINVFYHEMGLLKITNRRCGVGLLDKETKVAELSTMNTTAEGSTVEIIGKLKMEGHPVLEGVYNNWLLQKEYHPVLRGNEIKEYYRLLKPQMHFPDYPDDVVQYGYFFFFANGGVYAWTDKELAEDQLKIYRKFTGVLSLTYKRYKELKEAEERTQVAIRQSSLDRIRAEIASMRTTDDLQRITPSVWKELITLGVPFFRCGVFIINEKEEKVHIYLSSPDGNPLGVLHLLFTSSSITYNVVESWRHQQVYREHWNREQFLAWVDSMIGQGQVITATTYQAGNTPPESLTLQFVPFTQGMIYVGSGEALNPSHIDLVQALADAFSTAYARYEDFNRLEVAKLQVDNTLKELRSAQQQLIQAEKMASLGELTAGIAHEIQNPLNFINNFSEVNKELIEELEEEAIKGNIKEVRALATDLRDNEQKINHHGKRADAIVKGMLQHSRASTGEKELIDINALAEEYMRLSYQGLKAKNKNFKADFKTDFDETIGKIKVVPQDIGRVLLNLYNNAFYAASQARPPQPPEARPAEPFGRGEFNDPPVKHQPTVWVKTSLLPPSGGGGALISIRDNGPGIPPVILDKIFQPFFTTKPTGQGTGLGLSLSYDIVKAHGGELKVETEEGEGSEFLIQLPVS